MLIITYFLELVAKDKKVSKGLTGKKRKLRNLKDVSSDESSDGEARTIVTGIKKKPKKTTAGYDLWGSNTNSTQFY